MYFAKIQAYVCHLTFNLWQQQKKYYFYYQRNAITFVSLMLVCDISTVF